jgi:hypothetical protein
MRVMGRHDLTTRVTGSGAALLAVSAGLALWLAGPHVAVGVLGGGAVALLNFLWLARGAAATAALARGDSLGGLALGGAWLRHLASFAALVFLLAGGWGHPLGVALGLLVLAPVLVLEGLRDAQRQG